jgi:hypothetical protein
MSSEIKQRIIETDWMWWEEPEPRDFMHRVRSCPKVKRSKRRKQKMKEKRIKRDRMCRKF